MFLARHRIKPITPQISVFFPDFDGRLTVAGAWPFLHAKERLAVDQPAFVHQGKSQIRQGSGNGLVAFLDLPGREQRLIRGATLRVGGKQHQPRCMPVDTMQRHKVRVIQATDQTP
ncbi:hypothetical protein D3C73_753370 [compost metagenome]